MSDKKEWLKSDTDDLIQMYQNKPELWDINCKEYKNRAKKRIAMTEIAERFGTTIVEITRKIHNLRNQYNGEFKRSAQKNIGQSADDLYVSKWPYFKSLSFLQRSLIRRSYIGNIPTEEMESIEKYEDNDTKYVVEQYDEVNALDHFDEVNTLDHFDDRSVDTERVPIKKQKIEILKQNDSLMQQTVRTLSEEEDQFDIFGKYVASEMRNLSADYLRRKMKRKIQQIMIEINEEEELLLNIN